MTNEQLDKYREQMDNVFIDATECEESYDNIPLPDKPQSNATFYQTYHEKLSSLYYIAKENEDKAVETAEEDYQDFRKYLLNMCQKDKWYWDFLGYAHACQDFINGDA